MKVSYLRLETWAKVLPEPRLRSSPQLPKKAAQSSGTDKVLQRRGRETRPTGSLVSPVQELWATNNRTQFKTRSTHGMVQNDKEVRQEQTVSADKEREMGVKISHKRWVWKQKFQNTERKLTLLKRFNKISNQDELTLEEIKIMKWPENEASVSKLRILTKVKNDTH